LSTRRGRRSPAGRDRERSDAYDLSAYAAILDEHERHVFDYCSRLVGDEAEAASATETAMVAAQSLLADPDRLRAWLFALARQDIVAKIQPSDQNQDAEILDLVYRHGIRPGDLPAVLGVSPEHAGAMLADAEAMADALVPAGAEALADALVPAGAEAEVDAEALADALVPAGADALADTLVPAGAEAEVDASADADASSEADGPAVASTPAEIDGSAESDRPASPDEPDAVGEAGPASAPAGDPLPDSGSVEAFAALFNAYARNVFDYCGSMLGDQAEAAAATRATLISACALVEHLDSHSRLRAWLFALARTECNRKHPGRAEPLPSDGLALSELMSSWQLEGNEIAETDHEELNSDGEDSARPEGPVRAALRGLPARQREVLELVYRHGVRASELPAILGISADEAQTELTDAITSFEQSPWFPAATQEPDQAVSSPRPGIEQLSSLPLAGLPASLWQRTFRAVFDPDAGSYRDAVAARLLPLRPDGFPDQRTASAEPSGRRLVRASMLLGAMLLMPAAAGAVVYSNFMGSPDALARPHDRVVTPSPSTNPASPLPSGPHQIRVHRHRAHLKARAFASPPAASNPTFPAAKLSQSSPLPRLSKPGPSSSPSPTKHPSPLPTLSGSPSPTPTLSGSPSPTPPTPST
jgi:RNA polymerase sigma factor (sigma-70 family)